MRKRSNATKGERQLPGLGNLCSALNRKRTRKSPVEQSGSAAPVP